MKILDFVRRLRWINGEPLTGYVEPYRRRLFEQFFGTFDGLSRPVYNLALCGRAKKNWKSADAMIGALWALFDDRCQGNEVYVVANDKDQARDDLELAKLLLKANPAIAELVTEKRNVIERNDGQGFVEILPAQDVAGAHGKTYRLLVVDEIHAYRTWDLLEAMALDPTRLDSQQWITSYASLFHAPGVPLFDLLKIGQSGKDPRMLLSWYAADFTTDPDFEDATPEARANPSMESWGNPDYLEQQRRRLPAHKFRRLHLNLPGLPAGSAYQPEPVMEAFDRGSTRRKPESGITYRAFVDMSGGSSDDAVLAIGHTDADDRHVVDRLVDQGAVPPFDPRKAVERFVPVLTEYGVARVTGDRYAGETFRRDFEGHGIEYRTSKWTKSAIYEALEPRLNGREVVFPDVPKLEQQLLGLGWRGGKIDHQAGEHDDYANAAAGVVRVLADREGEAEHGLLFCGGGGDIDDELQRLRAKFGG